jgi:hypothetical protein
MRWVQQVALQVGDKLVKVDAPGQVWVVTQLLKPTDQQPHAVIVFETNHSETRMLAVSILCDKRWYRRLLVTSQGA